METQFRNLDHEASKAAQEIVLPLLGDPEKHLTEEQKKKRNKRLKEMETALRRALGVLLEQGVYAAILYLHAKADEPLVAQRLVDQCTSVFAPAEPGRAEKKPAEPKPGPRGHLEYVTGHVTNEIERTLLVRELWERTLTYAIYHCKLGS